MENVSFAAVRELFESNGLVLKKIVGENRIFVATEKWLKRNPGKKGVWSIPVRGRKVSILYYRRIQKFFDDGEDT